MLGVLANVGLIIVGGILVLILRSRIKPELTDALITAMGLVLIVLGITSTANYDDLLCVVVSIGIGTVIGELMDIQKGLDGLADKVQRRISGTKLGTSRFGEGFITCSLIFCVGAMAIMGSIEAGINHNYSILITKGVIDMVTTVAFGAAMGIGVDFSFIPVLIWQGLIALLAGIIAPYLSDTIIAGMTAVGGVVFIGIGLNMTGISEKKVKVANMIPALFVAIIYPPIYNWIVGLFK